MNVGGVYGFVLFMCWLHGTPVVLRATAAHLLRIADEADPPKLLTAKQVGALMALGGG